MWIMHDGFGWGGVVFGALWMIVFWGLIIGLIVWAVTRLAAPRASMGPGPGQSALDILKERYARGEITREQFESMKRDVL